MCAIYGAIIWNATPSDIAEANDALYYTFIASHERGRDGRGHYICEGAGPGVLRKSIARHHGYDLVDAFEHPAFDSRVAAYADGVVLGNMRAEPTTEFVRAKSSEDQQPYAAGSWTIVHNGTIANDEELRTHAVQTKIDSAAIAETLARVDAEEVDLSPYAVFEKAVRELEGSFAIAAHHEGASAPFLGQLYLAANYRPLWYVVKPYGVFFASAEDYFADSPTPARMLPPYSIAVARYSIAEQHAEVWVRASLYPEKTRVPRSLVVCSGGMDSVVAATCAQRRLGHDITLIHFTYGCRAQHQEVRAVEAVARELGCGRVLFDLPIYKPSDSPLLCEDAPVAGGEAGAEFAHEWVPARNLVMLSVASAYAEAHGYDFLVLGNNLEEAGAYPDNEPEFIRRFDALLPFAVGAGKALNVLMPVGNLMKHEIVALGLELDAPMHLTWSCYRGGAVHCGTCGPCYMRQVAYSINGAQDPLTYTNPQRDEE